MFGLSLWHWVIVLIIILLLFGAGRLKRLGSELAEGIKGFKEGLKEPSVKGGSKKIKKKIHKASQKKKH